jgi:hypothetical protein
VGRAMDVDDDGLERIERISTETHRLEAEVRRAILEQLLAQGSQVVGAREILDLAEAFAWVTNPASGHGGRS